jgi:integron integrase
MVDKLAPSASPPRLLDQVRYRVRTLHYSLRTETAYVDWIKRFILFHGKRHPSEMGVMEVEAFLSHLAVERKVSASTQNQALAALLFLYREVLGQELDWLQDVTRAKKPQRLPTVLSREEVAAVLARVSGVTGLVARLLYGTGMRLMEGVRLRVKDVDLQRREVVVREGKGGKDRVTMLPEVLVDPMRRQLAERKALFLADQTARRVDVWLPDALAVKFPNAAREWGWQYVFAAKGLSVDPRSGAVRRHHLLARDVQVARDSGRVGLVEVGEDVGGLEHLDAGVGIDQVGHLHAAGALEQEFAVAGGVDGRVQ